MSDKIKEKIQKVLELAKRGGTEAEADTAMRMALELLAKHNLEMSDISSEEEKDEDVIEERAEADITSNWKGVIWQAISDLYFCQCYHKIYYMAAKKMASFVVVGRPDNVATARSVIAYLITLGEELADVDGMDRFYRYSFKNAYCARISHRASKDKLEATTKLDAPENTCTALMVVNLYALTASENQTYLEQQGVRLKTSKLSSKTRKNFDDRGYQAGDAAGRSVSLRKTPQGRIGN